MSGRGWGQWGTGREWGRGETGWGWSRRGRMGGRVRCDGVWNILTVHYLSVEMRRRKNQCFCLIITMLHLFSRWNACQTSRKHLQNSQRSNKENSISFYPRKKVGYCCILFYIFEICLEQFLPVCPLLPKFLQSFKRWRMLGHEVKEFILCLFIQNFWPGLHINTFFFTSSGKFAFRPRQLLHNPVLLMWDGILMPPHMEVIELHNVSSSLDRRLAYQPRPTWLWRTTLPHTAPSVEAIENGRERNGVGVRKGERWWLRCKATT